MKTTLIIVCIALMAIGVKAASESSNASGGVVVAGENIEVQTYTSTNNGSTLAATSANVTGGGAVIAGSQASSTSTDGNTGNAVKPCAGRK